MQVRKASHNVHCLNYHLVLVCKYRKKLLEHKDLINSIWKLSRGYFQKHEIICHAIGTDKDHIHYVLEMTPTMNLSNEIRGLKSYTTFHMWELYERYLSYHFWKERTFWSDGYYVATIGQVSSDVVLNYVKSQGR